MDKINKKRKYCSYFTGNDHENNNNNNYSEIRKNICKKSKLKINKYTKLYIKLQTIETNY